MSWGIYDRSEGRNQWPHLGPKAWGVRQDPCWGELPPPFPSMVAVWVTE